MSTNILQETCDELYNGTKILNFRDESRATAVIRRLPLIICQAGRTGQSVNGNAQVLRELVLAKVALLNK